MSSSRLLTMAETPLEYEEFCRRTYYIKKGSVTIRCMVEKHGLAPVCWTNEMVQDMYNFVSDLLLKCGHDTYSYKTSILAGFEARGGGLVQFDIEGITIDTPLLNRFQEVIGQHLHNLLKKRRS